MVTAIRLPRRPHGRVVLLAVLALSPMAPARAGHHHPQPMPVPCVYCQTVYRAGDAPEDLQVHVVGERYDTVELYFKHFFRRDVLPGALNLHCDRHVLLAPKNPYGTVAIRYGPYHDAVRVYGWQTNRPEPSVHEIRPMPGYPVALEWVTTRILKVFYGPDLRRSYIVRFNPDDDRVWDRLFDGPAR